MEAQRLAKNTGMILSMREVYDLNHRDGGEKGLSLNKKKTEVMVTSGIKVGGYNMNNIRYADDTVLIADNDNELHEMLDTVVRESEKGLSLNKN